MMLFQKSLDDINIDNIREELADQGWAFLGNLWRNLYWIK